MNRIALRMLFADRLKYLTMVCGLSFAVLLITQQVAIFIGILVRSTGPLQNISQADVWVASKHTYYVDMVRGLNEQDLYRVRTVPGVEWAEPFLFYVAMAELPDGSFTVVQVIGIDRQAMVGQPPQMLVGRLDDLRIPDAVLLDKVGRQRLATVRVGDTLRINDRRAMVAGLCSAKKDLLSKPIIYTTYDNARTFVPFGRQRLSYILVKVKPGYDPAEVAARLGAAPHMDAWTADRLRWENVEFILRDTTLGLNFAITVGLGMVVGLVVSVSTFNQFTADNLGHFAVLKAMGARSHTLIRMVIVQALTVAAIAYGIGIGLAGVVSLQVKNPANELVAFIPWQLMVGALLPLLFCVSLGAFVALRRVLRLEPACVFE